MKRFFKYLGIVAAVITLALIVTGCSGNEIDKESGISYLLDKETDTYEVAGYTGGSELVIPSSYNGKQVTGILDNAFKGNKTLKTVTVPETVAEIGSLAFAGCEELTTVTFAGDSALKKIAIGVFTGCAKLETVVMPSGVTELGYRAFSGCSSLKAFVIPESIKVIDQYTFDGCSALEEITFLSKELTVKDNALNGTLSLKTVNYAGSTDAWNENVYDAMKSGDGVGIWVKTTDENGTDSYGLIKLVSNYKPID